MADLRSRFIEDYAGGLLNISRQELTSTGEVLSQDGLLSDTTLFIEDGTGTKSGLKLGVSLCESVDPTTEQGVVNVRYADRTYASIRDLKIFSTAIASAQAALSDAASSSISNLENAFLLLEESQKSSESEIETKLSIFESKLETAASVIGLNDEQNLSDRVKIIEAAISQENASVRTINSIVSRAKSISNKVYGITGPVEAIKVVSQTTDSAKAGGTYDINDLTAVRGAGAGFDITITINSNGGVNSFTIDDDGDNFSLGDEIIIPGSSSGGGEDIKLVVTQILTVQSDLGSSDAAADQTLADEIQKLIVKVNEIIAVFKDL